MNLGYVLTYAKIGGLFGGKLRSSDGLRVRFHEVEGLVCGKTWGSYVDFVVEKIGLICGLCVIYLKV